MKNILEDLFEGNLQGRPESYTVDPEYKAIAGNLSRTEEALRSALPESDRALVTAYYDTQLDLSCLYERRAFVTGVRLGVRLLRAMEEDPFAIA